jgi:cytochrome c553
MTAVLGLVACTALTACLEPSDPLVRGAELYESCLPCHGADGAGNQRVLAPAVAGLPQWYIEAQLMKFRAVKRGYHFDDLAGLRMRPMALSMPTEDDVKTVSQYIASLPRPASQVTMQGGNAEKGKQYFNTCIACHGADGMGNQALNAPALAGTDDWYMMEQLLKFKSKVRGDPAIDPVGATMQAMTATLPDEQAMKDVIAYIKTLPVPVSAAMPAPAPAAAAPAAPTKGH